MKIASAINQKKAIVIQASTSQNVVKTIVLIR
jgi:hypothetical protein